MSVLLWANQVVAMIGKCVARHDTNGRVSDAVPVTIHIDSIPTTQKRVHRVDR